jgi:hypothetical protein
MACSDHLSTASSATQKNVFARLFIPDDAGILRFFVVGSTATGVSADWRPSATGTAT